MVYPVLLVVLQSFQTALPGQPARYGLDGWRAALAEPALRSSLWNTLVRASAPLPCRWPSSSRGCWHAPTCPDAGGSSSPSGPLILPPLTVTLRWILLLDPEYGLINTSRAAVLHQGLNIYSFWGIVWVHVITGSLTVKVILLTPAFRNMNASFEEASGWPARARCGRPCASPRRSQDASGMPPRTGSPTVVLVAGLRGSAEDWNIAGKPGPRVFPEVAKFTRVCAYERPGTPVGEKPSRSDPVPAAHPRRGPRSPICMPCLTAAGEAGPYVLVAHSYGGLIGRLYASSYPDAVSGLVLVDALSEGLRMRRRPSNGRLSRSSSKVTSAAASPSTRPSRRSTSIAASTGWAPRRRCANSRWSCCPRTAAGDRKFRR